MEENADIDMMTYWFNKYQKASNRFDRLQVRNAANVFLTTELHIELLNKCITWHSDIMDESIWKVKKSGV